MKTELKSGVNHSVNNGCVSSRESNRNSHLAEEVSRRADTTSSQTMRPKILLEFGSEPFSCCLVRGKQNRGGQMKRDSELEQQPDREREVGDSSLAGERTRRSSSRVTHFSRFRCNKKAQQKELSFFR